ncbi:diphthamide synthesis protein [Candidatus Woesearchaeota archaeon]|nr:diphthamide synthesis protein [Candidatus Woesearchaeota archaeon]
MDKRQDKYTKITYNLELDRAAEIIKREKAKRVCIQLPDGLKPEGKRIVDELHERTGAEIIIWAGSCFGACDLPLEVERLGVELLIQWGHAQWIYAHGGEPQEKIVK